MESSNLFEGLHFVRRQFWAISAEFQRSRPNHPTKNEQSMRVKRLELYILQKGQLRDKNETKNCLAAIFDSRHQDVSSGPLGKPYFSLL